MELLRGVQPHLFFRSDHPRPVPKDHSSHAQLEADQHAPTQRHFCKVEFQSHSDGNKIRLLRLRSCRRRRLATAPIDVSGKSFPKPEPRCQVVASVGGKPDWPSTS